MRAFIIIILFISLNQRSFSQDKLFFADGTTKKGIIISNAKDFIYFKLSDTSATEKIEKTKLVLIEDYKGTRYIFGNNSVDSSSLKNTTTNKNIKQNILGLQPIGILVGRVTFIYERITKDGRFGFAVPFILSFDPLGSIYPLPEDSSYTPTEGLGFITGLDLNYYIGKKESFRFFIGPRFRYGTDMFFGGLKGYSIQTQFGWKVSKPDSKYVQHISFGFGFVRVIELRGSQQIDPKQSFPWGSINYRVGLNW